MVQPQWRTVRRFLEKLKIELPYDPVIPLLGIHPEKNMVQTWSNVHCHRVYKSQDMEAKKRSINRLMDKDEVVYVPNGIEASGTK